MNKIIINLQVAHRKVKKRNYRNNNGINRHNGRLKF